MPRDRYVIFRFWLSQNVNRVDKKTEAKSMDTAGEFGATETWRFSQLFGEKSINVEVSEVDIVSTLEFDETGDFLAVGDRGGRVVVFEQNRKSSKEQSDYKFYAEFQSHECEFDYLKSLEIEEKINKIKWCKRNNSNHLLLTTNDKTIKLWRLYEKNIKQLTAAPQSDNNTISLPKVNNVETIVATTPKKIFSNAHDYHINSISLNSDGETYISADDLRINLWNLEISNQSYNIVDIKPENMEELTEVITSAEFHPHNCHHFVYSTSKGVIKLSDLRKASLCDVHAKSYIEEEDASARSFFSEIISSISDCKFSGDGRYILARDYMTLKIWDMNMDARPLKTINIHEHLRSKLCDVYENDFIFDKFECHLSHDGSKLVTGSYNNLIYIYDWTKDAVTSIEANKLFPASKIKTQQITNKKSNETIDYHKKCLHVAYHPRDDIIAVGVSSNLFIYDSIPE